MKKISIMDDAPIQTFNDLVRIPQLESLTTEGYFLMIMRLMKHGWQRMCRGKPHSMMDLHALQIWCAATFKCIHVFPHLPGDGL